MRSPKGSATSTGEWLVSAIGGDASRLWLIYVTRGTSDSREPLTVIEAETSDVAQVIARERLHNRGLDAVVAVVAEPLILCPEDDVSGALLEDEKYRDRSH